MPALQEFQNLSLYLIRAIGKASFLSIIGFKAPVVCKLVVHLTRITYSPADLRVFFSLSTFSTCRGAAATVNNIMASSKLI